MVSKEYNYFEKYRILKIKKYIEEPKEIKNEEDFIKKVSKKVYEKLDFIRAIYEDILNPDISDLAVSYEIKYLKIDIKELWKKYKEAIKLQRMYELAKLKNDKEGFIHFMKEADNIIEELISFAEKILKEKIIFWEKDIEYKKPKEYLG